MSKKVFLIAGEASGDVLGGALMEALKAQGITDFSGVGGECMSAQGLESLLPMEDLCVMGVWEVLWQIQRLNQLIVGLVEEIEKSQPDVLVTIDLPDFNFRVAERLKKRGVFKGKIVHYGAPTVWAWRPGRAQKVARFLDGMMCLFPFEPAYFKKVGLKSAFVGHPLTEIELNSEDTASYLQQRALTDDDIKIGVLFGSREAEVDALGPVILEAFQILHEQEKNLSFIVPTLPHLELNVTNFANQLPGDVFITTDPAQKYAAFGACDLAVAVSGTVGLELAYAGVPHLIAYKMHPITFLLVKLLVKVKHAHLANILLKGDVVPELIQFQCTPFNIAKEALRLIRRDDLCEEQKASFKSVKDMLSPKGDVSASQTAAKFVLSCLK